MEKKILLTGAGGRLGSYLREPLSKICNQLVSTDIKKNIGKLNENENYISADLSNFDQICEITKDVSLICHFGALVDEVPFNDMLGANFIGSYNVWESARLNNCRRVVYSSSIHAVGMYNRTKTLRHDTFSMTRHAIQLSMPGLRLRRSSNQLHKPLCNTSDNNYDLQNMLLDEHLKIVIYNREII